MTEELEQILSQLTQPDNAIIQQATAQLKQAFKDPAIIPGLCAVMSGSQNPQIRQSAAVMLRLRVKKHWKKISPNDRERFEFYFSFTLPVGLLLLNKVIESNPEPFKPHYCQLLQLLRSVLEDHNNPTALYYCILTLTAITEFIGTEEMVRQTNISGNVQTLKLFHKRFVYNCTNQASEAMEVFNELMESEVSVIVPHVADVVRFFLEVGSDTNLSDSLRVKALSCVTFLIKLKSKTVLKQKLLSPILQAIFPVLTAAPPPGEQDPEDEEDDSGDGTDNESPKHCAAQIIDTMALHMPPEKLFQQLMPLTQTCLASENPYQRKGGLMCLAVLAEGCADHIRTKILKSVLQTVCQSLSDSSEVVRSAGLFALGQFSEHLQPEVSTYCSELMPLLLGYLSSLNQAKVGHVTKAFYALENFMENLGADIEPYLPTLMETMLSALNNTDNLKIKELAVSAIGAIANAAKELLVPYFTPVIESLKGFLTTTTEEMRSLQTQSLDTLSVLARTIGKDVFSPLAAECVQLGLNLTNTIDDPDLRRCTYSLYSAVSIVTPDCLTPHLTAITTVMLYALKSSEGVTVETITVALVFEIFSIKTNVSISHFLFCCFQAHLEEDKAFVLLDDDDDENDEKDTEIFLEDDKGTDIHDESAPLLFIHFNFLLRCFCTSFVPHSALLKLLDIVVPCFLETVRREPERHVVMGVLESMNSVIKSCKEEVFKNPSRLKEISHAIRDVLKKKVRVWVMDEYDAMLQEFAGEGIPLVAASVPADNFFPFLNDLLPFIMNKAKSSCTVADRSFSVGTIAEILHALMSVSGGRGVAGRLSNRLLPVLVAGAKDSDPEVRNNSVFGLGCLAQAAGPIVVSDYPMMLSVFSNLLSKESDLRVIDNLCAALCRMIMSNVDAVPLEQVSLVARLPLEEDQKENHTVFSCLAVLYTHSPALVQ
uniref:Importin N-terminal domain-containing protein n=1 Tax=Astatotilapia calliptera TaxID=8154 RepID=A0AAX7UA69_ASTCA